MPQTAELAEQGREVASGNAGHLAPFATSIGVRRAIASGSVTVVVVAAYVILTPVAGALPGVGLFNSQRIVQLLVLAAATLPLLHPEERGRWIQSFALLPAASRWGFVGILGLGGVTSAFAPHPRFAFLEVGMLTLVFILTVQLAGVFRRDPKRTVRGIVGALALGAVLYLTSFAVGYVFSLAMALPVWPSAFTGFAHVRFFNQIQVWTIPLIVLPAALLPAEQRGLRGGLHAVAALWYALLFASGGRGATLALAGAAVLALVLFRSQASPWLRLQLKALVGGLALYVLLFVLMADNLSVFTRLQDITNGTGRLELWGIAVEMIGRHPVMGEGPMQFARHLNVHASHPHNAVLQWAAEWGLLSTVGVVALFGWGGIAWARHCRRALSTVAAPQQTVLIALTASLTAAAAYALVDGVLVMPVSQMLVAVIAGWALAVYAGSPKPTRLPDHHPLASWILVGFLVAVWGSIGYGIAPDITSLEVQQEEHIQRTGATLVHPRFWQQGFIEP